MVYVTVRQSPAYKQLTLDQLLFGVDEVNPILNYNKSNTHTYEVHRISASMSRKLNTSVNYLIRSLEDFNRSTDHLRDAQRQSLYYTFYVPKRNGKMRRIDAPNPDLMIALRNLKTIFEERFKALYHTSAFAYIKNRSTIDAVKRHQSNESKWFGKYDLSDFFGSTTLEFVMQQFSMVYPFSEVVKIPYGQEQLEKALELAFLNGGLPQGTPISPLITNIMMIPVDFRLANTLRDYNKQHYVYTRYADDFIISSKYGFDFREIEGIISGVLASFKAPFSINKDKTRYGSSSGSNWNLGVMLNSNNEITVGYKNKKRFQAMVSNYALSKRNGELWDIGELQHLEGIRSYYRMVEPETIDKIMAALSQKFNMDIIQEIKNDLRS